MFDNFAANEEPKMTKELNYSIQKEWKQRTTVESGFNDFILDRLVEENSGGSGTLEQSDILENYFDFIMIDPDEENSQQFRE
jgi:hypothetical protein